jgi:hypothetical protein
MPDGGRVCVHKNGPLMASDSLYGFTLLEMVLSLAFAGLIMVAIMASLVQFNEHKLLAQVVVKAQSQSQLAVAQLLNDWRHLCGAGVTHGNDQKITLMRSYQGRCVHYEYAHNARAHGLTRRRHGGRSSGFLANIEAMDLSFGIDSDQDCQIDHWRPSYQINGLVKLHQVRVSLQLRLGASRQLRALGKSQWEWHGEDEVVLHRVMFIWRLDHVCA